MAVKKIGIIMNGVTGRMGANQHLLRSICAIRDQGGVRTAAGEVLMPDPILIGRNQEKLEALAQQSGIAKFSTDLSVALQDPAYPIYFDAQTTQRRCAALKQAIAAGKHIYCEKPIAEKSQQALDLYDLAQARGVKNGVVQDKLWLPGLIKLRQLIDRGSLGRLLDIRIDFGYWVFEGHRQMPQRPSWNYRAEDGGGIIVDMFCHFSYVLESLVGRVSKVLCKGATLIGERLDENREPYRCTADDAAYGILELDNGVIAQVNASWVTRVKRDDLLTLQINGTEGSALAGLRKCWVQRYEQTPRCIWNPDLDSPIDFQQNWEAVDADQTYDNAFKIQWELFLRHVVNDEPYAWNLLEGARNVLLAEVALDSWRNNAWKTVPSLAPKSIPVE